MKIRAGLGLLSILGLAACAKPPEAIGPSYVSDLSYQALSCEQLSAEAVRLSDAVAISSMKQRNARANDTVGVLLIGLPVSTLSGDNQAADLGRLKGEYEAVRRAALAKNCKMPATTTTLAPRSY